MIPATLFTLLSLAFLGIASAAPENKTVDGVTYHILSTSPDSVRILWIDSKGNQMRTLPRAARYLTNTGHSVDTVMNGGIFEPGGIPSGLLIQNGVQLRPVNRDNGNGNFFLKPNGIFLVGSKGAAVIATEEDPLKDVKVLHAVQSGPLLLRNAKVHPAFNAGSTSRLHRNGVGVTRDGNVVIAISDIRSPKLPNLYEFAQLFRLLGCDDALSLDCNISQMRSGADLTKPSNQFGTIIAVLTKSSNTTGAPKTVP